MKYLKSYSIFESQGWSLEEIIRMAEAGLMSGAEKTEETRKAIRQILAEAGEMDPWSAPGQALLRDLSVIAAVGTPEAEPFLAAGWQPTSTIVQLANGTLVWSRPLQSRLSIQHTEELIFYEATGYARHNIGNQLQPLLRKTPGGGLSFYRGAMQELNERWAIEESFVPNRKTLAQARAKDAVIAEIREFLAPKFKDHKLVLDQYLQFLANGGSAKQLAQRFQIIQRQFPSLPLWGTGLDYEDLLRTVSTAGLPDGVKFWLASHIKVHYWAVHQIDLWQRLLDLGLVDTGLSKTITQR
jgi:hypothetical protein